MSPGARKWARIGLAGPGAVVTALVTMAGMALWLPGGAAGIDNLVLPLVLFPLIWSLLFFHACLDARLLRVTALSLGLLALHGGLVVNQSLDRPAVANEVRK